jgi:hypothetical protein
LTEGVRRRCRAHLVNSGQFDGTPVESAKQKVTEWLAHAAPRGRS